MMPRNGSLLFSIEQWELIRRLRNSGLTKEQIGQAFDDLNKIEQDLGNMYNLPAGTANYAPSSQINSMPHLTTNDTKLNSQILSNMQIFQMAKNLTSMSQARPTSNSTSTNSSHANSNGHSRHDQQLQQQQHSISAKSESSSSGNDQTPLLNAPGYTANSNGQSTAAVSIVNAHFNSLLDSDQEAKQIEEFKSKGEVVIHGEISFFVYKHDLKQSQIARMAGVNQAYVSKFLRGEFFDLSENGKSLIYKWYLRYLKNATIFHQAHNISVNPNVATSTNGHQSQIDKSLVKSDNNNSSSAFPSFNNVTNTTYETPKRTRFSFKAEHLIILEKAFVENHYPDQKKREELAKQCNDLKTGSERVTEQIITHWFQNKRKITRKANTDDQASISPNDGTHNSHSLNGDYHELSYQDDYRTDSNANMIDYQNDSPIDYQEFIEEDNELYNSKSMLNSNKNSNRNSTDSIDY